MPANIGYARVSREDQNLALQLDALTAAVCLRIFSDKGSGVRADRPGLADALRHLRPGDTFMVWKLDRVGRHVGNLVALLEELDAAGVHFRSLTEGIDTATPMGRFFFHVVASFAQMERELTIERTRAGLAAAAAAGRRGGRRRLLSDKKLRAAAVLFAQGLPVREICEHLAVSRTTLYRALPASARQIELPGLARSSPPAPQT